MTTYTGGCHCGQVRYEVEADIASVISCNCSHCAIKGLLLTFVPKDSFKLLSGEDSLTEYRFNKKTIEHLFCKNCGVEAFGNGSSPDGAQMVAINVRTIDNVDISTFELMPFDGKAL